MRAFGLSWGAFLTWVTLRFHSTPDSTMVAIQMFLLVLALDTFSGVVLAVRLRRLRSKIMRVSLVVKLTQYAMIMGCGEALGMLVKSWFPVTMCIGACAFTEMLSIVENCGKLQGVGGADMGPFKNLLRWLGHPLGESADMEKALEASDLAQRPEGTREDTRKDA